MLLLTSFLYLEPLFTHSFYHHLHFAKPHLFSIFISGIIDNSRGPAFNGIGVLPAPCSRSWLHIPFIAAGIHTRPCWFLTHNHSFSCLLAGRIYLSQQRWENLRLLSQPALHLGSGTWSNPAQRGWIGNLLKYAQERFSSVTTKEWCREHLPFHFC